MYIYIYILIHGRTLYTKLHLSTAAVSYPCAILCVHAIFQQRVTLRIASELRLRRCREDDVVAVIAWMVSLVKNVICVRI